MGHHTFDDESGPQAKWDALSYKAKKPSELEPYQIDDLASSLFKFVRQLICPEALTLLVYHLVRSILDYLGLNCRCLDLTCKVLGIGRSTFYKHAKRVSLRYNIKLARRRHRKVSTIVDK